MIAWFAAPLRGPNAFFLATTDDFLMRCSRPFAGSLRVVPLMRGLFHAYLRGSPGRALAHFERAAVARPDELRLRFHRDLAAQRCGRAPLPPWSEEELEVVRADPMMLPAFGVGSILWGESVRHTSP